MVFCQFCESSDIDEFLCSNFGVKVCHGCKDKNPPNFKLITKTEAKNDYLLTEEELNDANLLPYFRCKNPRKSEWSDMKLYMKNMIENFAIQKWGSLNQIEDKKRERNEKLREYKISKYKKSIDGKTVFI